MSPLAVRPGRNAVREAKRLKEIRRVKGAILWSERERAKRRERLRLRWETKQAVQQRATWHLDNVDKVRARVMANVREDWRLGPLRPNRAYGPDADKYGALTGQQISKPEIPVSMQKRRYEESLKWGGEPEYPIVVDDAKYFHIVKDDRVVIMRGRERGKIGKVQSVMARTHEVLVEGLNKYLTDSSAFNAPGEAEGPTRASEVPIPIDHVRLVIPYEITQRATRKDDAQPGEDFVKVHKDVIVDRVVLERHTTGIDPYTGTDYGDAEIPKEHQHDPLTGLPIFHRYVAGTRQRIAWPGEKEEEIEDVGVTGDDEEPPTFWDKVKHPIKTYKKSKSFKTKMVAEEASLGLEEIATELNNIEAEMKDRLKTDRPKSHDARFMDAIDNVDTTRNIVEDTSPIQYKLISPPFPEGFGEELRAYRQKIVAQSRKDKDDTAPAPKRLKRETEQGRIASELAKAKHAAAQRMKTPMQLRWEMDHAKKVKQQKKAPLVSTDDLMAALDKHLKQKRHRPVQGAQSNATELD